MKLTTTTAALSLAALTLTSCGSRHVLTAGELSGEWAVARLDGKAVDPGKDVPYLGFDSTRVYGFTGCNRLMGSLPGEKMKRGEVDFGRVATTMMACPDNRYEQAFMNALRQTERMALVDGQLVMIGADRREVMALERRPFQVMSPDGTWDVTDIADGIDVDVASNDIKMAKSKDNDEKTQQQVEKKQQKEQAKADKKAEKQTNKRK